MNLITLASWPELAVAIVFLSLGAAMLWYARVAPERAEKGPAQATQTPAAPKPGAVAAPAPKRAPEAKAITWPLRVDESAQDLDSATRLDLIERMGTIGGKWGAGILAHAFPEEREPELRDAILASLIACGERESLGTFEAALHNERPAERAYAVDGLAAMGAYESAARAFDDPEEAVALAAAYALRRAGQSSLVDRYLTANAGKPRADALRKMIEVLS